MLILNTLNGQDIHKKWVRGNFDVLVPPRRRFLRGVRKKRGFCTPSPVEMTKGAGGSWCFGNCPTSILASAVGKIRHGFWREIASVGAGFRVLVGRQGLDRVLSPSEAKGPG